MTEFVAESRHSELSAKPGRAAGVVSTNAARKGEHVLEMEHIGKRFDEVWVLKDVTINVRRRSVHAIVGHNGAGKSTLMKIALGAVKPTEGEVRVAGKRLTYSRPAGARTLGLGMVCKSAASSGR